MTKSKLAPTVAQSKQGLGLALFALTLVTTGLAQQTVAPSPDTAKKPAAAVVVENAPADKDVLVLSPFVVDASGDEGYRARNTLSGSRINTPLKDIAASITEITPEFLKDIGAADMNDVLTYTVGSESNRNFTNALVSGVGGYQDLAKLSPNESNRLRGLRGPQVMRDYFVTIGQQIGFDTFNVDRVTLNRGPNSVLFGLGDPSGSVNYAPKVAKLNRTGGEIALRYGSNDDKRATIEHNQVLIPNELAIMFAGVASDRGFQQQPAHYRDNRGFMAATYQPFKKTTLRANYERATVKNNAPNSLTPIDHVTPWINQGSPTWDSTTQVAGTQPANLSTSGPLAAAVGANGDVNYIFNQNAGGKAFYHFFSPTTKPGALIYSPAAIGDTRWVDLFNKNLRADEFNREYDSFTLNWDQEITKDLFFNAAYLQEKLNGEYLQRSGFRANRFGVFTDINKFLPNGQVNPHFGELYQLQDGGEGHSKLYSDNQALRATLNYSVDFTKNDGASKWLGRHSFTGFIERRESENTNNNFGNTRAETATYAAANGGLSYIRYLGTKLGDNSANSYAAGIPIDLPIRDKIQNTYWTGTGWAQDTYSQILIQRQSQGKQAKVNSQAFVWQSHFLNDRVSALVGYRKDKQSEANYLVTPPVTAPVLPNPLPYSKFATVEGKTKTYGVVVHATKWLSFFYNQSETLQAFPVGTLNLYGERLPLPSGPGKDYGFNVELLDSKLNVRVNWYNTDIKSATDVGFTKAIAVSRWELPFYNSPNGGVISGLAAKFNQPRPANTIYGAPLHWGVDEVTETSDVVAEGIEIEVTYNPTKNWRIMANVTKQSAVQSNLAPGLKKFVDEVLPLWKALPYWDAPTDYVSPWGTTGNLKQQMNANGTLAYLDTFQAFEGRANSTLREWRANVVSNYSFTEGALKGWNAGGAVRFETKAIIGYRAIPKTVDGNILLGAVDFTNPFTQAGEIDMDAWVGYTRKIMNNRYNLNIQLNVRDLTSKEGLKVLNRNSDGTVAAYRIEFGPTWTLQTTFGW